LVLADATGSLEVDAFGDKFPVLLGVDSAEFSGYSREEKAATLQYSKFSEFVAKIKTDSQTKKSYLQDISKQGHDQPISEIRRRTV
jgi:hypothetical protein